MIFLIVFAAGSVACCWKWADLQVLTKCVITVLYAASWLLLLIPYHSLYLFPLSQCAFAIVVGGLTFGIDWLMSNAN